jgi:hypothetical protein
MSFKCILQKIEMLFFQYRVSIQPLTLVTQISYKPNSNNMSSTNVTQLDLSTFSATAPSICIPRVFSNITQARVEAIFRNLGVGELEKVDMVRKTNAKGEKYQRVFVHFKHWNDDEQTCQARQMLLNDQEVKVVYDDPWFWKLSASKSTRPEDRPQRRRRPAPFVDFSKPAVALEEGEVASKKRSGGRKPRLQLDTITQGSSATED